MSSNENINSADSGKITPEEQDAPLRQGSSTTATELKLNAPIPHAKSTGTQHTTVSQADLAESANKLLTDVDTDGPEDESNPLFRKRYGAPFRKGPLERLLVSKWLGFGSDDGTGLSNAGVMVVPMILGVTLYYVHFLPEWGQTTKLEAGFFTRGFEEDVLPGWFSQNYLSSQVSGWNSKWFELTALYDVHNQLKTREFSPFLIFTRPQEETVQSREWWLGATQTFLLCTWNATINSWWLMIVVFQIFRFIYGEKVIRVSNWVDAKMVLAVVLLFLFLQLLWHLVLPRGQTPVVLIVLGISFAACVVIYWNLVVLTNKERGGYLAKSDLVIGAKLIAFIAAAVGLGLELTKALVLARTSVEFYFTEENNVPLLLVQVGYLTLITSLYMPLFFKIYGAFIFGSYGMILNKGFDQALAG